MEDVGYKEKVDKTDSKFNQDIYSQIVRAGKRTYFFDVKSTRNDEYYLTITESKKRYSDQGKFHFEKHKIFLYKEDFERFADSLQEVVDFISKNQPEQISVSEEENTEENTKGKVEAVTEPVKDFTDITFEDI
ncbi:MAG: PUR family DNA/RNA-binding protein [Draconibacterium sp.]|nr:PUR family DNA/RNA-binding protein [Draconibacterium sp.]